MKTQRLKALFILLLLITAPTLTMAHQNFDAVVMVEYAAIFTGPNGQAAKAFPKGSPITGIELDRRNPGWVKVVVNGETGYMHQTELTTPKKCLRYQAQGGDCYVLGLAVPVSPEFANPVASSHVSIQNLPPIPGSSVIEPFVPPTTIPVGSLNVLPTPAEAAQTLAATQPPVNCTSPAVPMASTLYIKSTNLNLRETGSTDSASLGKFPQNTSVQTLCRNNPWIQVKIGSQTGWMHTDYLTGVAPIAAPTNQTSALGYAASPNLGAQPAATPAPAAVTPTPQAFVGRDYCLQRGLNSNIAEDRQLVADLQQSMSTPSLGGTSAYSAESDTAFRIESVGPQGGILITITRLSANAKAQLFDALNPFQKALGGPGAIDGAIQKGEIQFEVRSLCRVSGLYQVGLEGAASADGKKGTLTLQPSANQLTISGNIGDSIFNQEKFATGTTP